MNTIKNIRSRNKNIELIKSWKHFILSNEHHEKIWYCKKIKNENLRFLLCLTNAMNKNDNGSSTLRVLRAEIWLTVYRSIYIRFLNTRFLDTRFFDTRFFDTRCLDTRFLDTWFLDARFIDTRFLGTRFLDIRFIDTKFLEARLLGYRLHLTGDKIVGYSLQANSVDNAS